MKAKKKELRIDGKAITFRVSKGERTRLDIARKMEYGTVSRSEFCRTAMLRAIESLSCEQDTKSALQDQSNG